MTTPRNHRWRPAASVNAVTGLPPRALDRIAAGAGLAQAVTSGPATSGNVGIHLSDGPDRGWPDAVIAAACRLAENPTATTAHRDEVSDLAYQVARHALAPFDPAALRIARLRAAVLDEHGHHQQAAQIWGQLIGLYQLTHQPGPEQHARLAHAVSLHRAGGCGEAINQMTHARDIATHTPRDGHPPSCQILRLYLAILTACGLHDERHTVLAETTTGQLRPHLSTDAVTVLAMSPTDTETHQPVCAYRAHAHRSRP